MSPLFAGKGKALTELLPGREMGKYWSCLREYAAIGLQNVQKLAVWMCVCAVGLKN